MIYLDNAATTKVAPEVFSAMLPYFMGDYGNSDSIHSMGRKASEAVEQARKYVAEPLNADPNCIIFTSGGSEANSMAITGLADYLLSAGKTHIITSSVEHHSVLEAMKCMFHKGFQITYLQPNKYGEIGVADLKKCIRKDTGLVSIMGANNELGNVYDIYGFGDVCHDNGVLFHTDCVQAYLTRNIDVNECHIDFLSASGHKFYAPKGIGFLYARHKEFLNPIIFGGEQEYGIRGGTENVPYIVAMGEAARIGGKTIIDDILRCTSMKLSMLNYLLNSGIRMEVNSPSNVLSKILNVRFPGVDSETLLLLLDASGVIASAGSACSSHIATPSHVLKAIGLTDEEAKSSIRFSFSKYLTSEEVISAAKIVADSVKKLQGEI